MEPAGMIRRPIVELFSNRDWLRTPISISTVPDHRNYPSYPKEWEQVKMAWMKKNITIPDTWKSQQIKLYFEAVAGYSEVYINKEKLGAKGF